MNLAHLLRKAEPDPDALPEFIRAVEKRDGVRILRLQGSVGREIASSLAQHNERLEQDPDVFRRSVLLDFADTTGWDFATVAFLVEVVRRRLATGARVGIIHASDELLAEMDLARIEQLFLLFGSEQDALAALGPGTDTALGSSGP